MRSTYDEFSRRIDEVFNVIIEQCQYFPTQLCLYTWDKNIDNVVANLCQHRLIIVKEVIVLRANNNRINTKWNTSITIFNRHLTLCIRTKISHLLSFTANFRQGLHQQVRQLQ